MSLPLDTIASLSQSIVDVYTTIEDELIFNIAKHFNTGKNLATTEWQIKKLAELGKLTQENMNIIANMVGQVPELTKVALESVMWETLKDLEPSFAEAVKQGYLGSAKYPPGASKEMIQALDSLSKQAINDFNLVNSNMLNSSLDAYRKIVANTVTMANYAEAQAILNSAAGSVVTGVASRQKALADAIKKMADNGITGFYDKAGKEWSPEAYINMTVRTTMTSTAHASVDKRMQEYDTDIFEVSSHSASRPMCEPYQGKLFSSANKSGYAKDLGGNKIHYAPASSTTMGQPAGLFGINCGHFKTPFIPGFSRMSPPSTESKAENDAAYKQNQEQRKIERDVKEAKREAQAQKLAGNQEAFDKAAARVKLKQDQYKAFCNDTGRTPRPDRLQVTGYDKKTAQDVKNANFKAMQDQKAKTAQGKSNLTKPTESAIIKEQSYTSTKDSYKTAKYTNIDKAFAGDIDKQLLDLSNKFPIDTKDIDVKALSKDGIFGCYSGGLSYVDKTTGTIGVSQQITLSNKNMPNKEIAERKHRTEATRRGSKNISGLSTVDHEYAHAIDLQYAYKTDKVLHDRMLKYNNFRLTGTSQERNSIIRDINDINAQLHSSSRALSEKVKTKLMTDYKLDDRGFWSRVNKEYGSYATTNPGEFMAEAFSAMRHLPLAEQTEFMKSFNSAFAKLFWEVF